MKKIFLSMVGSLLISICALYAQQVDTTGSASGRHTQQSDQMHQQQDRSGTQGDKWQQQGDRNQGSNTYANEGMVIIDKNELPSSLKKTLQKDKYSGWENGTIYHNTNTDEYVIAPKAYRFDKSGKEMEMGDNAPGYGRSSRYGSDDQSMQRDRSGYQSSDYNQSDRTGNNSQSSGQPDNNAGYNNQSSDNNNGQSDNRSQSSGQSDNANQSSQSQSGTYRSGQSSQQPSSEYRSGQDTQTGAGTQTQPGQSGHERSSTQNDQ
jgi:hypothetical protein